MPDRHHLFFVLWTRLAKAVPELSATEWTVGGLVLLLAALALLRWPKRWERARTPVRWCVAVALCGAALWRAWDLRWVSDDAFISFRYARNFAEGYGLVFNPGERVEGYTNFLWTALLVPAAALKIPLGITSIVLGLLAMAAAMLLTVRVASIICPRRGRAVFPIAALLLATSYVFANYGTSGLETMFAAALVLLALERALAGRMMQAGLAGILATMAHPDHGVFYAALGAAIVLDRRNRRDVFRFALPFLSIYLPYFLARWWYYGSFFPNTYYAKSGGDSYYTQGLDYVLICVMAGGLVWWLPMFFIGLHAQRHKLFGKFMIIAVPVYLLYVMKIGGDFMLGRLFVPLLPLAALAVESGARHLAGSRRLVWAMVGVVLAALSALPIRVVRIGEKFHHVADERSFYEIETLHPMRIRSPSTRFADRLKETVGTGFDGPLVGNGCVGIVGYETGLPFLDAFGLTDPVIARKPIAVRGRPGHEKLASGSEMFAGGAVMTDIGVYPPEYDRLTEALPGIPVRLVAYREDIVRSFRKLPPDAPLDVPHFLKNYQAPPNDHSRFMCDLWFFEAYYFAHQGGERREEFVRKLQDGTMLTPQAATFYSLPDGRVPDGYSRVMAIDFAHEDFGRWMRVGTAFDTLPATSAVGGQSVVAGNVGPFINTFTVNRGDDATGALQSPSFRIDGDVITLRVGGGRDSEQLRVSLIIEGREAVNATGCGTEIMGRRIWDVSNHIGREASVMIVDRSPGRWGHILVDEIEVWRKDS